MPTTERTASKATRRNNPAVAAAGEPLPFPQPSYPIKPWVDAGSGLSFHTVSVHLDEGNYLCIIAEFPQIRVTSAAQADAERNAIELFRRQRSNPLPRYTEDEALSLQCDRAGAEGYTSAKSLYSETAARPGRPPVKARPEVDLFFDFQGAKASARFTTRGFVVSKGSTAVLLELPSAQHHPHVARLRERLVDQGVLVPQGDTLVFTQATDCRSPCTAATIINGGRSGKREFWKTKDGTTLKQLDEQP